MESKLAVIIHGFRDCRDNLRHDLPTGKKRTGVFEANQKTLSQIGGVIEGALHKFSALS